MPIIAVHWACVVAVVAMKKGFEIVTRCTGRCTASSSDPIVNDPEGISTSFMPMELPISFSDTDAGASTFASLTTVVVGRVERLRDTKSYPSNTATISINTMTAVPAHLLRAAFADCTRA